MSLFFVISQINTTLRCLIKSFCKKKTCPIQIGFSKTVPAIAPDKSYVMFKVSVHNEEEMKKFASGNNPIAKPIFDECIEIVQMYELSKVNL